MTTVVSHGVDDGLDRSLRKLVERTVDRDRQIRHGLLAVSSVDGSSVWSGASGQADRSGAEATPQLRYPIASVTKLFTAAVVMRLVEDGALALDSLMVELLPTTITDRLHVIDGQDHTHAITVAHLLSHTSGLADYYEEAPRGGLSAQARLLAGQDAPMPFEEVLRVVRDDLEPHFPPQPLDGSRARARYADTNYQLLGAIIETTTGSRLADTFATMVFAPLGLDDTSSYPHPSRSGASGLDVDIWAKKLALVPDGALRHQVADGGIVSTLDDQVRFARALVDGSFWRDNSSWLRMQQHWNRIFFPIDYGLGVMRYAPSRWMSPLFAVPPIVGHSGSTATWLFHCPDLDVVVAGTFDVAKPPLPFRFLPRVLKAIVDARG